MAGDTNMSARNERIEEQLSPVAEERPEVQLLLVGQDGEARQGIALVSADGGGQPPHTAAPVPELRQLLLREFDQAVRRVGADCVNGLRRTGAQPVKAICPAYLVLLHRVASFNYSRETTKPVHLQRAMNEAQRIVSLINANLLATGAKPLPEYIQGNNFSGLVSNILCDAIHENSPFRHNSHQAYPDLINPKVVENGKPAGLEVKSTIQIGKGGESHNGHSGWHLVACFAIDEKKGNIRFVHVMLAVLNGHTQPEPDWVYVGSKVNADTGSRRTETYNTTLIGTTKLRDGSVYLDPNAINFKRWRQSRRGPTPAFSIFAQP